ncbi:class I SAM-dependent methyltransferase [uncultured Paraglaciecola sp.]|uniref:class I SAM-dependent methyltransferase n=1 Tax=uncultured Paraglaciecola sp. TaxID=1765024 RepID=UPI0026238530|nr:class I SAM-dependent methyltransferase [uncultured Paraglaciecola sp.]
MPHWNVQNDYLEITEMPFYWRLNTTAEAFQNIATRLPVTLKVNSQFDYLELDWQEKDWAHVERAYMQDANIGFINPESGQMDTYGSSVNNFFLNIINSIKPKKIFEIGCGAGFSIKYLAENGWQVVGVDPSEYSYHWSQKLGFELLNTFFDSETFDTEVDFIYCNDVFEHIRDVHTFAKNVFKALNAGGTFCFSTTNSTESIAIGDISMIEHQHVNMFTERSIYSILISAGFGNINIGKSSYGNTFHVTAQKATTKRQHEIPAMSCDGYFSRAASKIQAFADFYARVQGHCNFYVPLRCIPYLATVGDFGKHNIYDSNTSWHGKYIDGYALPISLLSEKNKKCNEHYFIGSMTFFDEIKKSLISKGISPYLIQGVKDL